ncbi:MAG: hypothetical protein U9N56_08280 [Actinomycetota bacterium]|nr:hypothetical protein [Actinomycetota bacterium]
MEAKTVLHAAVGAPVVAYRKVGEQVTAIKGKVDDQTTSYTKSAEKAFEGWATEGEKVMTRIGEGKVVEEISSKVDLDQAKEQVTKLRDQLEDMLATWRTSFRPEKADEAVEEEAVKAEKAKKPAAKTSTAKKPAAKTSAAKTTKSSTATKTSSTKSTSEKKAS